MCSPPHRTAELDKTISALLDDIKKDVIRPDKNSVESLQRIGTLALPELLTELRDAKGFYQRALIHVLAGIPSPERDEAFFKIAQEMESWPYVGGFNDPRLEVLSALAEDEYLPVIPLLERYTKEDFPKSNILGFPAGIALNILGRPLPPKPESEVMKVSPSLAAILETGKVGQLLPIVYALMDQSQVALGSELVGAEEDSTGSFVFRGKSKSGKNSWRVNLAKVTEDEALVFVFAYYGYVAKLKYQNGRWLLVNWKLVMMQ